MGAAQACFVAAALAAAGTASAQTTSPRDVPLGGRPAGLGHAYSALAEDAYAPIWNPAGLAVIPGAQAAIFQASSLPGSARQAAAVAVPLPGGHGVGLSADSGRTRAYGLSVGRAVGAAAFGLSGRLLDDGPGLARGYAADLGYLYRFDRKLTAAVVAANLGGRPQALREEGWEPQARFGSAYAAAPWLTYALEGVLGRQRRAGVRSGFEVTFLKILTARLGVDSTVRDSPALGLTAGAGVGWAGSRLDVAFVPRGAHSWEQLTFSMPLGAARRPAAAAQAQAEPPAVEAERRAPARRDEPLRFELAPSSATAAAQAPAASPTGFLAEPPPADWDKPREPAPQDKPAVEEPRHPSMIWFQ